MHEVLYVEGYDYSDPTRMGTKVYTPRIEEFRGTSLEPLFGYLEEHLDDMLHPRLTAYWGFLFDPSMDAHMFGGIWPEVLGTIYLTLGAMLFAVPFGVIAAIYLVEYAGEGHLIGLLRVCVSTLAGVPSIVFGLFGLAFFINTMHCVAVQECACRVAHAGPARASDDYPRLRGGPFAPFRIPTARAALGLGGFEVACHCPSDSPRRASRHPHRYCHQYGASGR